MAELTPGIIDLAPAAVDSAPVTADSPPIEKPENSSQALWSIPSLASLACGIILIVPYFAGLAAIALGIIGIRQINESFSKMRGRRLALAGVALGLLNILGWTAYFKMVSSISEPGRVVAHRFMDELSSGNTETAKLECTGNVHADRLAAASNQVKSWGGVKHLTVLHVANETSNGVTVGSVRGIASTGAGDHLFQLQTVTDDNLNWKISDFTLQ